MEDVVRSLRLTPRQVLRVFFETCSAVAHMHSQKPPIIHRDLKVNCRDDDMGREGLKEPPT